MLHRTGDVTYYVRSSFFHHLSQCAESLMGRPEGMEAVILSAAGEKPSPPAGKGEAASLPRSRRKAAPRRIARRLAAALGQADYDVLLLAVALITR